MVSEVNGPTVGGPRGLDQRGTKIDGTSVAGQKETAAGAEGADVVTLTDLAGRLQKLMLSVADLPVADREKVEAVRQSIADGSYEIDPNAVAEKLTAIESLLTEMSNAE